MQGQHRRGIARRSPVRLLLALVVSPLAAPVAADEAAILRAHGFTPARAAWFVATVEDFAPRSVHEPDRPVEPASLAKLVTAAAALEVLGPDARPVTELRATGTVRAGVLTGDLALVGGGDPLLDPDHLLELAFALREAGVQRVTGRLLLDDTRFPRFAALDPTEPEPVAWNAGVGPLVVGFARVRPEPGPPPFLLPPVGLAVETVAEATGPRRTARGFRIAREAPPPALPLADPGMAAARLFHRFAADLGIDLPPPVRGRAPADARLLARHSGPPLAETVRGMLRYSNNQLATMVGLETALRLGPPPRDLAASAARLVAALVRRHPDLDAAALAVRDHAGLDPRGRVTVRGLARLLAVMFDRFAFPARLPANGGPGTLTRRLLAADLAFRVRAKTGSAAHLVGLAGYLFPERGDPLVFAVILGDEAKRRAYLAARPPDAAMRARVRAWKARARAAVDALVATWLRTARTDGTPRPPAAGDEKLSPGPPPPPAAPRR